MGGVGEEAGEARLCVLMDLSVCVTRPGCGRQSLPPLHDLGQVSISRLVGFLLTWRTERVHAKEALGPGDLDSAVVMAGQ